MHSPAEVAVSSAGFQPEPAGYIDLICGAEIVGWLCATQGKRAASTLRISVDGSPLFSVRADVFRPDVLVSGREDGNVGFHFVVPREYRGEGPHEIELFDPSGAPLYVRDVKTDVVANSFRFFTDKSVRTKPRRTGRLVVNLDVIDEGGVIGWAYDESRPLEPAILVAHIDGTPLGETVCDTIRDDVRNSGHPSAVVGFSVVIPDRYFDDETHVVEFRDVDGAPAFLVGADTHGTEGPVFRFRTTVISGQVDGLHGGGIRGWVVQHDRRAGTRTGGLQVLVTLQGQPVAQLTANLFRADVAEALHSNPNCGFLYVPPPDLVSDRTVQFHFKVIPGSVELANSPYVASFPGVETNRKLRDLALAADALFTQLWALRSEIKGLLPAEQFTLQTYDSWARIYYRRLDQTPAPPLPPADQAAPPLVSVICPCFRPRMKDFVAAVESIISQTYLNWELIIVDDDSKRPELTACIKEFVARDSRICARFKRRNGGISEATNTALSMAHGRFVALFDHDDMMVPRALEYMVEAALRTGAKMLYCDEDKIDDDGVYSEVNLKPDWNYRLLLAQNYICHILFVERAHLSQAGALQKICDGAQDHELILRLAEITPAAQIHHVPEILYHWRKTPYSTAASGKAKAYTVEAGIRAISGHLERKGLQARVRSPLEITVFDIVWRLSCQPKVTIIIPYREHVGMTTECLDALRNVTAYANYEILLMDNWSVSDEALAFADAQNAAPATRVIRVEAKFNYSRINNIAVAASESEFLLFMNNDVVVQDPDWLTQMMGEALADPAVGAVGNKLFYPNGLVQHGGIILGVGGIGDHAHRGLTADDPGYMARAICAQDMSAVTAACLLCKREAFDAAGGFDERDLQVAFNDVDLCLKMGRAGYRVVWTPSSWAEHRESLSRGSDFKPEHQARFFHENKVMEERWAAVLKADPHYNRNFSRQSGIFSDLVGLSG